MTTAAAAKSVLTITMVHVDDIRPSPSNPRKTFKAIDELAENIKTHGIKVPLRLRPAPDKEAGASFYELVFGERRWRAAKKAGLKEVPAILEEMTDAAALELMLIELAQTSDVHPVEEAEAYRELHEKHHLSVEEIAAKVGKSKRVVYERMQLCRLAEAVKKAALEGRLPASHAVLIARIPDKKLQAEALKQMTENDEVMSYRDAADLVHRKFMLQLGSAPFDTADEKLLPLAGSCAKCPKRTGNQRELFSDVKSPDVCTDTVCFEKKVAAAAEVKLKVVEEKGREVLRGEKASKLFDEDYNGDKVLAHNSGFVPLESGTRYIDGRGYVDVAAAVKKDPKIKIVAVAHPETGKIIEVVPTKELPKTKERAYGTQNSYDAAQKTREANEKKRQAFAIFVLEPLVKRAEKALSKPELIAVIRALINERTMYGGLTSMLERRLGKSLTYAQSEKAEVELAATLSKRPESDLRGLLFELATMNKYAAEFIWKGEPEGNLAAAAEALGVDVKAERKKFNEAQKAPAPAKSDPAAAEKPAAKKKGGKKK